VTVILHLSLSFSFFQLYDGIIDAFVKIYRHEGIRAFYKGLGASYLGVTETVVQFTVYEYLKHLALRSPLQGENTLSLPEIALLSSVAKLIASAATYPHEVIRTRLREQRGADGRYKGPFHGLLLLAREEGARGLYGGMGAHLIRTVPNAAILLLSYELTLTFATDHLRQSTSSSEE